MSFHSRITRIGFLSALLAAILLGSIAPLQASTQSQALVTEGRALLFNDGDPLWSEWVAAEEKFADAVSADGNDQEAQLFHAISRVMAFGLEQDNGPGFDVLETFGDFWGAMGMLRNDTAYVDDGSPFTDPPDQYDDYDAPATFPAGNEISAFLAGPFIDLIDDAIANLDEIDDDIDVTIWGWETGDIEVEIDWTDVMLFKAWLYAAKTAALIVNAYDVNLTTDQIRELFALANADLFEIQRDLLDRYTQLLQLKGSGDTTLANARAALLAGIDCYQEGLAFLLAEEDYQEDDLFYLDNQTDVNEAQHIETLLTEIETSLNTNQPAEFVDREEEWILTDGTVPNDRLGLNVNTDADGNLLGGNDIWGLDSCDFIFCEGNVEKFEVSGDQITIEVSEEEWCTDHEGEIRAVFTGTLNEPDGDQIVSGTYTGQNCGQDFSGNFTGARICLDNDLDHVDFNSFFGNTGKLPMDLRDVAPEFDKNGRIIPGTFPPIDDSSPVLNGILPDYPTNYDMARELELQPSGNFNVPVAAAGSIVLDGSRSDWDAIAGALVLTDIQGDNDTGYSGTDMHELLMVQAGALTYFSMSLYDGDPAENTAVVYQVGLRSSEDSDDQLNEINAYFDGSDWMVSYTTGAMMDYYPGNVAAGDGFIEWAIPTGDLYDSLSSVINGMFVSAHIQTPDNDPCDSLEYWEENDTGIKLNSDATVTGTVSCTAHNGSGFIVVEAVDGPEYHSADILGTTYINSPGSYTIHDLPDGEEVYVFARWDADGNGTETFGDYWGTGGPVVLVSENNVLDLNVETLIDGNPVVNTVVLGSDIKTKPGMFRVFGHDDLDMFPHDDDPNEIDWGPGWTYLGEFDSAGDGVMTAGMYYEHILVVWHRDSQFAFDAFHDMDANTAIGLDEYGGYVSYDFSYSELAASYSLAYGIDGLFALTGSDYGFALFSMPSDTYGSGSRQLRMFYDMDTDDDELTDSEEINLGTDPDNRDTDGDRMPDGWEVEHGLNPLFDDASWDLDDDMVTNVEEYFNDTLPESWDSFDITGVVANVKWPGGSSTTHINVCAPNWFPGELPDDVESITIEGPNGYLPYTLGDFTYLDSRCFELNLPGAPEIGVYNITMRSKDDDDFMAAVGRARYTQSIVRDLPFPDLSTFSPADSSVISSKTPTFSWEPVDYPEIPLNYQLSILDTNGEQVFLTELIKSMTSFTIPPNTLIPGEAYQWQLLVTDDWSNWLWNGNQETSIQNIVISDVATFTVAPQLDPHDAVPAIDIDGWGAVVQSTSDYTNYSIYVRVIDHDGVASDGSSHTVTVTFPNSNVYQMHLDSVQSPISVGYYVGGDFGLQSPIPGDYTFTVVDPEGNVGTFVDTLVVAPIDPVDPGSLQPSNSNPVNEYMIAYFDNVLVNGVPYDDFNDYTSIDQLDHAKWGWPSDSVSVENQSLRFEVQNAIGRGHTGLSFRNPLTIESIQADITVSDVSSDGPPRARIVTNFFGMENSDCTASISVKQDRVQYSIGKTFYDTEVLSWPSESLARGDLMTVTPGQAITVRISWDGTAITFAAKDAQAADFETATYTPDSLTMGAMDYGYFQLQTRLNLNVDTTDQFSWAPVAGANQYRVRIDDAAMDNANQWKGYPGNATEYTLPPGGILPNAYYRYRIDAWDAHDGFDIDNASRTPANSGDMYRFYTTSAEPVAPHIELEAHGVSIWSEDIYGDYINFWVEVHDAQGVPENIEIVKVTTPDGAERILHYNTSWDTGLPTSGYYYLGSVSMPMTPGDYTFTVEDKEGHTYSTTEILTPAPIGYPDEATLQPVRNSVVGDTAVFFNWEDVPGAAFYRVDLYDKDSKRIYRFNTTESQYDLGAGFLEEGQLYRYRIRIHREFYDQNIDNASESPSQINAIPFFTTEPPQGVSDPLMDLDNEGVLLMTVPDYRTGGSRYFLMFTAKITDLDGLPLNIASVTATYPDGDTAFEMWYDESISDTEAYYWGFEVYDTLDDVQEGLYTFTATDFSGSFVNAQDTLTINTILPPTNLSPAADSYVQGTQPTISWDSVSGASRYRVKLYEGNDTIHWSGYLTGTSYQVPSGILESGKNYNYRIYAYHEQAPDTDVDNVSANSFYFSSYRPHFTTGASEPPPPPPEYDFDIIESGQGDIEAVYAGGNPVGGGSVPEGSVIQLTAVAQPGWTFSHWSGDVDGTDNPVVVTVGSDFNVTAHFIDYYTLTIHVIGSGTASPAVGVHQYDKDEVVSLSAVASDGWLFDSWAGNVAEWDSPDTTITMDQDQLVIVTFYKAESPVPWGSQNVITNTANAPQSASLADVDGDGVLDLVAAESLDNGIFWYENIDGDGSSWSTTPVTVGTVTDARAVFTADIDGDGDVDVVSSTDTGNAVFWHENTDGDGSAWNTYTISDSIVGPDTVIAADIDDDGDLDVISGGTNDGIVVWYENDGTPAGLGDWTVHTIAAGADGLGSVYAADVNGDGKLDIIAAADEIDTVAWYENDGSPIPSFIQHTVSTQAYGADQATAADIDNDGDMDIIAGLETPNHLVLFRNLDGSGMNWQMTYVSAWADPKWIEAADFDNDGDMDILAPSWDFGAIHWYENTDGLGLLWDHRGIAMGLSGSRVARAGDVDGDGDLDVLSVVENENTVAWYENQTVHRSAAFGEQNIISTAADEVHWINAVDMDSDGDTDVVSASNANDTIAWYRNLGSGDFDYNPSDPAANQQVIADTAQGAYASHAVDLDHDGDMDVLSASQTDDRIAWYENDGEGGWTTHDISAAVADTMAVFAADMDQDGDVDVLAASLTNNEVLWFENDGTPADGGWVTHAITVTASGVRSVYATDMDGDGDTDVLCALYGAGQIVWFENDDGVGTAWNNQIIAPANNPRSAIAADFNGDGHMDVASAAQAGTSLSNVVVWYENDGSGGWTTIPVMLDLNNVSYYSVHAEDLDLDGDMDLLSAASNGNIAWYENENGAGGFGGQNIIAAYPDVDYAYRVTTADLDNDGDPDVLSASYLDDKVAWYENLGGQFALETTVVSPPYLTGGYDYPPFDQPFETLQIDAHHRGRVGDADIELQSIQLLFEESAGDPLTSIQANAVIESLHIYLDDTSGGVVGEFDIGYDSEVAVIDTLSLVSGVQTVAFSGGADFQITPGTPRTYFIVVTLDPEAVSANPRQFMITHLTETSPAAVDVVDGIPMTPEYQINVSTGVIDPDSDGDGMADSWEVATFGDLTHDGAADDETDVPPFVGDSLTELEEFLNGTSPFSSDFDADGFYDGEEVAQGSDPTSQLDTPVYTPGTYYVDIDAAVLGNGTSDFPWQTLHHSLDRLNSGVSTGAYVLNVAAGTYSVANGEPTDITGLILSQDNFMLQGTSGVILDGSGRDTAYWQNGFNVTGTDVTLDNLEIANFDSYPAIFVSSTNRTTISNCSLHDSDNGIYADDSTEMILYGCEIFNMGAEEAAIEIIGGSDIDILNCRIHDNDEGISATGGAELAIVNNQIHDNGGGGISLDTWGDGSVITRNTLYADGNAISLYNSSPEIRSNTIHDSYTGISIAVSSPTVFNNLIYDATGAMMNGISIQTVSTGDIASPLIYHNTIDGMVEAGIYLGAAPGSTMAPEIKYNIITNGTTAWGISDYDDTAAPVVDYNNVWNNSTDYYNVLAGANDISMNPLFVDRAAADFHLVEASPCIDTIPTTDTDPLTVDLGGTFRPIATEVGPYAVGFDMGCYEFASLSPEQRAALIDLYSSTGGDEWDNNSGWKDGNSFGVPGSECSWFGVTCTGTGAKVVAELRLPDNNLEGYIPESIGNLTGLLVLDLSGNQISGEIPATIDSLTALQRLDLSGNEIWGYIPVELTGLTGLQLLYLNDNNLLGPVPSEIVNMTALNANANDFRSNYLYVDNSDMGSVDLFLDVIQNNNGDWEDSQKNPIDVQVKNVRQPDGSFETYLEVIMSAAYGDDLPEAVDAITVQGPEGALPYSLDDFEYLDSFRDFFIKIPGSPSVGEYTVTVDSGATTAVDSDYQAVLRTIPIPDEDKMAPSDRSVIDTTTPSFAWDPVGIDDARLYYRFELYDTGDNRVHASGFNPDMSFYTLPDGLVTAGRTYWWRVRVVDSGTWEEVQNRANSPGLTFTTANALDHAAQPAIDIEGWGGLSYANANGVNLEFWIKVIDHDGVSADGSSHTVTVTLDGIEEEMDFVRSNSNVSGSYEFFTTPETLPALGSTVTVTFTVTDADGNTATLDESFVYDPLAVPEEDSLSPGNRGVESAAATFDNVVVNGADYDSFESGEINSGLWEGPQCSAGTAGSIVDDGSGNRVFSSAVTDAVGQGNCGLEFVEADTIDSIQADITLAAGATDNANARISGYFFNNGVNDVGAKIFVSNSGITYTVTEMIPGGTLTWIELANDTLAAYTPGESVTVGIAWDEATGTLTFTAGETTATYTHDGYVRAPLDSWKKIRLRTDLFVESTTPTFSWDAVPDAVRYRVRIYDYQGSQIYGGQTGRNETRFTVPPGVLEPNAMYKYRLEAWDSTRPGNLANLSKTPADNRDNYIFYTPATEAVEPMIDLDMHGALVWNDALWGQRLSLWVKVHDAQGVPDNIESVTCVLPNGQTEVLYLDSDGDKTSAFYHTTSFATTEDGSYTFRVVDKDGHSHQVTDELASNAIGYPPESSLVPAHNTLLNGTSVDFDWADVTGVDCETGAGFYRVEIFDTDYKPVYRLWTCESQLSLPAGYLAEETLYRYRITTRREFFDQNVDNMTSSPSGSESNALTFTTTQKSGGTSSPVIDLENKGVYTRRSVNADAGVIYDHIMFHAKISDSDGVPRNIASVQVIFPDETTLDLKLDEVIDAGQATYWGMLPYNALTHVDGEYTFVVTDFDGNLQEASDDFEADLLPVAEGLVPAQDGGVSGAEPTISWNDVADAAEYRVRLYDEWGRTLEWSDYLTQSSYTVPAGLLEISTTYSYRVYAYLEAASEGDVDNISLNSLFSGSRPHFTTGAAVQDRDGDGTPDEQDGCDTDPRKTEPGECGCGVVEDTGDTDEDGILNCLDVCPDVGDTDEDGLDDCVDTYPNSADNTPQLIGPSPEEIIAADTDIVLQSEGFQETADVVHENTYWLVRRCDDPESIYTIYTAEDIAAAGDLDSHTVGKDLDPGLRYSWRVGYEDSTGHVAWSEEGHFSVGTVEVNEEVQVTRGIDMASYRMVSFVQWPDDPDAEAVLGDDLTEEYTENYRIGTYDAMTGGYIEYGQEDPGLIIEPGRSYWMIARVDINTSIEGVPVSLDHDIFVGLSYNPDTSDGWNMVASPNEADYQWGDVQVVAYDEDGEITFGPMAVRYLSDDNAYIDKRMWYWAGEAYAAVEPGEEKEPYMERYKGYWVKARSENVFLKFAVDEQETYVPEPQDDTLLTSVWRTLKGMFAYMGLSTNEAVAESTDTPPMPIGHETDQDILGLSGCFVEATDN